MRLLLGDCLDKLKELDDNSVDSIVTDPPYGLSAAKNSGKSSKGGFMGKEWDYDVPSQEIWEECMRVLKPGGHLLSFAGSRTYHRMAVRIEDAGFEIRDQIMWVYGSGFPKSMNVGMKVDEKLGNEREVVGKKGGKVDFSKSKKGDTSFYETAWNDKDYIDLEVTKGNSEWEGWGTALKPAHEPIVMARKPLSEKTVVDNVLEWGTGGINIDDSRIQHDEPVKTTTRTEKGDTWNEKNSGLRNNPSNMASADPNGRFPANIIFDEEAGKILDEQSGITSQGHWPKGKTKGFGEFGGGESSYEGVGPKDKEKGGASRFFYCPKTSKTDRNEGLDDFEEKSRSDANKMMGKSGNFKTGSGNDRTTEFKNNHPTVKPTDLMLYLIRLVTPKGGTTLDPFMGSGSSGKAAVRGGFDFVGVEREEEYMKIAKARIQYEQDNPYNEETNTRVHINKNSNKFW
jgi:DNA modification methylase